MCSKRHLERLRSRRGFLPSHPTAFVPLQSEAPNGSHQLVSSDGTACAKLRISCSQKCCHGTADEAAWPANRDMRRNRPIDQSTVARPARVQRLWSHGQRRWMRARDGPCRSRSNYLARAASDQTELRDDRVHATFRRLSDASADTIDRAVRVVEALLDQDDPKKR